jgi:undecaprenyl diphosphate synthase
MVPNHIAFIMDGNGRWAKAKGKPRSFGHKQGSETLKQLCKDSYELGVKYVTVYAFSTENWKRSTEEVTFLMNLLRAYLKESIKNATQNNMKVRVIGRREDLDEDIQKAILDMENASKDFTGLNLTIALNYGGRDEIIRGIKKNIKASLLSADNDSVSKDVSKEISKDMSIDMSKNISLEKLMMLIDNINEETFGSYLDTHDIPDPDLLIRTSGEYRTSNFLPWQLAYTEFYFTDKHWPDFDLNELKKALDYYERRDRRFGGVKNED